MQKTWKIALSFSILLAGLNAAPRGLLSGVAAAPAPASGSPRVVHQFDFDERGEGNLESLPKYWVPLPHPSFPNFAGATFDFKVGHTAPPSFHIAAAGRDAACIYNGPETRVTAGVGYRIAGFVLLDRMEHARACISAVYLDAAGRAVVETQERSEYLHAKLNPTNQTWLPIELHLQPAPENARTIGVIAWVLQEATWDTSARTRRSVHRVDVHGGAWFDDITIFALPKFDFGIIQKVGSRFEANPSNVVSEGIPAKLRFAASELESADLLAELLIRDANDREVRSGRFSGRDKAELPVEDLPPGWYRAHLEVSAAGNRIVSRELSFLRLAALRGSQSENDVVSQFDARGLRDVRRSAAASFGLELHDVQELDANITRRLVDEQIAGALTIPVWPGVGDDIDTLRHKRHRDLIRDLARDGHSLTGVLAQTPREISEAYGAYTRSVFDLLADDPSGWQPLLAAVAAPYAAAFRAWQIGPSDGGDTTVAEQKQKAAAQVRAALDSYVLSPRLAMMVRGSDAAEMPPEVENLRVLLDSRWSLDTIRETVAETGKLGHEHLAVLVPPLDRGEYARVPRLSDWAKRMIVARHAGADVVYAPQTWSADSHDRQRVAAPTEDFIVFRTLADALGDALPGPPLPLGHGITGLSFFSGTRAVVAVWDARTGHKPRELALTWAPGATVIDLWGMEIPQTTDASGRRTIQISSTPMLILGADKSLVSLAASMTLSPIVADAADEQIAAKIEWTWAGSATITGICEINAPPHWEAVPRSFRFALSPRKPEVFPMVLRHAHNESVGEKELVAKCVTDDGTTLQIPLRMTLEFPGLEVRGAALVEGNDLLLRQTVRNVGAEPFHLRGSAAVPGRERQYRPFVNLLPGQVQAAEYRFRDAANLIGRRALLSIRELNDGTGMHSLELQIP